MNVLKIQCGLWRIYRTMACLLVLLALMSAPVYAERKSDQELFQIAFNAYTTADYVTAATYLRAYIERDPYAMRNDPTHVGEVQDALEYAILIIEDYKRADQLFEDLLNCRNQCSQANTGSSVSGITRLPPELGQPSTTAPMSYSLVCRGGPLHFTYAGLSNLSSDPQIWIAFSRARERAGSGWQNVGQMAPGECTWLDRPISANEPGRIVLRGPELRPDQFAISWQNGQVSAIATRGVARSTTGTSASGLAGVAANMTLAPQVAAIGNIAVQPALPVAPAVSNLASPQNLQAFDVYNDNQGNFIATAIGQSDLFASYVPLFRVVNVSADDHLNVRSGTGVNHPVVGRIPHDGMHVEIRGSGQLVNESLWIPVRFEQISGWVNGRFLMEQGNLPADNFVYVRPLFVRSPVMSGLDVAIVQRRLRELGYTDVGPVDGFYGNQTRAAVVRWQQNKGLTVDGVVGPQTWRSLFGP